MKHLPLDVYIDEYNLVTLTDGDDFIKLTVYQVSDVVRALEHFEKQLEIDMELDRD